MRKTLSISIFLALSLVACYGRGTDEASLFGLTEEIDISGPIGFEILKSQVLGPSRCLSCHVEMNSESSLISRYVRPGAPEASSLFIAVSSGRMPQGGPRLSKAREDLVRRYIVDLLDVPSPSPIPSPTPVAIEPTYRSLKAVLIERSCVLCHSTGNTLKRKPLDTYEDLKTQASEVMNNLDIELMPPSDSKVPKPDPAVIEAFRTWIKNGYPN